MIDELMRATFTFEQWLNVEAEILDGIDFDSWFNLLHSDIEYRMPVRVNKDGMERPDFSTDMYAFNEDIQTLKLRIERLKTDYAWAEIPPSRTRRLVSNVRVKDYVPNESAEVYSYLLLYRSRTHDIKHDLISGERRDEFKYQEGAWKLSKRFFIVDQTTINTRNLGIFV